jgi:hypothetical protein
MAETPPDFTRAEDTVLNLSDNFAAKANAKSVYGEPVHAGSRTIIPVAKIGYLLGATSGGGTVKPLEGVVVVEELAQDLSVISKSPIRGRGMWSCRQSKRRLRWSPWDLWRAICSATPAGRSAGDDFGSRRTLASPLAGRQLPVFSA